MALTHWGFFGDAVAPYSKGPSVWDYLFGDQPVLGLVRLAVFSLGIFLIASLAALLVRGKWITSGLGVKTDTGPKVAKGDEGLARQADIVADYRNQRDEAFHQRDVALEDGRAMLSRIEQLEAKVAAGDGGNKK